MPNDETLLTQAVASENTVTVNSVIFSAPVTETTLGEQREQVQPRKINPL